MSLVSSNKLENSKVELIVEVKGDVFKAAVEKSVNTNLKKINLPGFRKGKAPRNMVIKQYGMGMFLEEAVNALYPNAYAEAAEEANIDPVDVAEIEITELNEEGFTLKAVVVVRPEAEVSAYKGLTAEKAVKEVTEEDLEAEIKKLQERNSRTITVEDGKAENGHTATIDFEGFVDGVAFEGGKGEGYPLVLGSGSFIPGFEDQVVGHATGEEFDVNVTFPEAYGEASLAGKAAVFKVKIHELTAKELPEADDEFAKDVSEFDTIAELKADIKKTLVERAENQANVEFENNLMTQVANNTTVEIPNAMIEKRIDELARDFEYRLSMQGMNIKMFMQYTNQTMADFRNTFKDQATEQVKGRLALLAVAKAEGFEATDAEVEAQLTELSETYNMPIDQIKASLPVKDLKDDIICNKALDVIRTSAVTA